MFTNTGESQVSTIATPSFSNALEPTYILTIQCSDSGATDSQDLTVNIDANANFVLTNFVVGIGEYEESHDCVNDILLYSKYT